MNSDPQTGQRYISTSEPALGLGMILSLRGGHVEVHFPATGETRTYSMESAPLARVIFAIGDEIANQSGQSIQVEELIEEEGLLSYRGQGILIGEGELLNTLSFSNPEKRLLAGLTGHPRDFELRMEALRWNTKIRRSPASGYTGARIDLIPHQLSIVAECANRLFPRVLLADEVGLGKTIEACLILHRLHLTGRANRILILVPEPLIHQWFVELLRRFHLLFAIFDEERCESIRSHDEAANPFADSQLILCAVSFFVENPLRAEEAKAAGFDLLIVDEAHHLEWMEGESSPAYAVVESLSKVIPSLLLLTATPQKLGPEGHFARLRLLDPDRYPDLSRFIEEVDSYEPLAAAVDGVLAGGLPKGLADFTKNSPQAEKYLNQLLAGNEEARTALGRELIDSFGTGRVLFRNTRERLKGFPKRIPQLHPLGKGASPYVWLADLLRKLPAEEKILLITNSVDAAISVQEKLLAIIQVESALFHEELTLLQRDRNAAWFAEEEGARILLCSEIGSEGRNFQFARHLVLFGLPRDPEVLEQRIGRLDRIGQTGDIQIHIPYGKESRSELQALWLHEGLDAFSAPLKAATALASELLPMLDSLENVSAGSAKFKKFLSHTQKRKSEMVEQLRCGHDRLLELGVPPAEQSAELLVAIQDADQNPKFAKFIVRMFDQLGLDVMDLSEKAFVFKRGQRQTEAFADIPESGLSVTLDRETALAREDLSFLTMDHPLFRDALSQLLDGSFGNAVYAEWKAGQGKAIILECAFVLEVIAAPSLHLDRFLPPTLMRVILDHNGKLLPKSPPSSSLQPGNARRLVSQEGFRRDIFPKMLMVAKETAKKAAAKPIDEALELTRKSIQSSINRLEDLSIRNASVSPKDVEQLRDTLAESLSAIANARVRMDSLRLVFKN